MSRKTTLLLTFFIILSGFALTAQDFDDPAYDSAAVAMPADEDTFSWDTSVTLSWDNRDPLADSPLNARASIGFSFDLGPLSMDAAVRVKPSLADLDEAFISWKLGGAVRARFGYGPVELSADSLLPGSSSTGAWQNSLEDFLDDEGWLRRAPQISLRAPYKKGSKVTWDLGIAFMDEQMAPQILGDFLIRYNGKASALGAVFSYAPRFLFLDSLTMERDFFNSWMAGLLLRDHGGSFLYGAQLSFGNDRPDSALFGVTPQPLPYFGFDTHLGFATGTETLGGKTLLCLAWLSRDPKAGDTLARTNLDIWASQSLIFMKKFRASIDAGWRFKTREDGDTNGFLFAASLKMEK